MVRGGQGEKKQHKISTGKSGWVKELVMTSLGVSILVGGTVITPNFPIILGMLMSLMKAEDGKPIPEKKVHRVLQQLEKKQLIALVMDKDQVTVQLTEKGKEQVKKYSIRSLLRLKHKKESWQGKWALVIFDVPELERAKRDALRSFLLWVGFYPYQKSVYAFPYECEQEVKLLQDIVEGGRYIRYILAEKLDRADELVTYFKDKEVI